MAQALHQLASLCRQIPAPVLLLDQARVARRRGRGLVLIPLGRVRIPHLAETPAALGPDAVDGKCERGSIDAELLDEAQRERELDPPLREELWEEGHELDRVGRFHAGTAFRVASRTASCFKAMAVLSVGSARTYGTPRSAAASALSANGMTLSALRFRNFATPASSMPLAVLRTSARRMRSSAIPIRATIASGSDVLRRDARCAPLTTQTISLTSNAASAGSSSSVAKSSTTAWR